MFTSESGMQLPPSLCLPGGWGGALPEDPTPSGGGLYGPQTGCTDQWVFWAPEILGIQQGQIFLFDPMRLYSKYSEFCGDFENG